MFRFFLMIALLLFCIPAFAQTGTFTMTSGAGTTGDQIPLEVLLDNDSDVQGFSMGVSHDGALATIISVVPGTFYDAVEPDIVFENLDPLGGPGWTIGVVNAIDGTLLIPPGTGAGIVSLVYEVVATAPGTADLTFNDQLADPTVDVVFVVGGQSFVPTQVNGQIDISVLIENEFLRGDATDNGVLDIADPIVALLRTFGIIPPGTCDDVEDIDDNGVLDMADGVYLLTWMFAGGPVPPEPFAACGLDPSADTLGCESRAQCP